MGDSAGGDALESGLAKLLTVYLSRKSSAILMSFAEARCLA